MYVSVVSDNLGHDPTEGTIYWIPYSPSSTIPTPQDIFLTVIGDGTSTDIVVSHNLNSLDVIGSIYSQYGDLPDMQTVMERINVNQVRFRFYTAPAVDAIRTIIVRPGTSVSSVIVGTEDPQYGDVSLGEAAARDVDTAPTEGSVKLAESGGIYSALILRVLGNTLITAGTHTKITYDAKGLVTGGTDLIASDIPALDASKIASGVFDIERIPQGAVTLPVIVADDTARFALTTAEVQNGDTVKVLSTGLMYLVADDTQLSTEAGYLEYHASTDWVLITGKPTSFNPTSHASTHLTGGTDAITPSGIGAVAVAQGIANEGKSLVVNSAGEAVATTTRYLGTITGDGVTTEFIVDTGITNPMRPTFTDPNGFEFDTLVTRSGTTSWIISFYTAPYDGEVITVRAVG